MRSCSIDEFTYKLNFGNIYNFFIYIFLNIIFYLFYKYNISYCIYYLAVSCLIRKNILRYAFLI